MRKSVFAVASDFKLPAGSSWILCETKAVDKTGRSSAWTIVALFDLSSDADRFAENLRREVKSYPGSTIRIRVRLRMVEVSE